MTLREHQCLQVWKNPVAKVDKRYKKHHGLSADCIEQQHNVQKDLLIEDEIIDEDHALSPPTTTPTTAVLTPSPPQPELKEVEMLTKTVTSYNKEHAVEFPSAHRLKHRLQLVRRPLTHAHGQRPYATVV